MQRDLAFATKIARNIKRIFSIVLRRKMSETLYKR
jgi:hypothetical protein